MKSKKSEIPTPEWEDMQNKIVCMIAFSGWVSVESIGKVWGMQPALAKQLMQETIDRFGLRGLKAKQSRGVATTIANEHSFRISKEELQQFGIGYEWQDVDFIALLKVRKEQLVCLIAAGWKRNDAQLAKAWGIRQKATGRLIDAALCEYNLNRKALKGKPRQKAAQAIVSRNTLALLPDNRRLLAKQ